VITVLSFKERWTNEGESKGVAKGVAIGFERIAELIRSGLSLDEALRKGKEDMDKLVEPHLEG